MKKINNTCVNNEYQIEKVVFTYESLGPRIDRTNARIAVTDFGSECVMYTSVCVCVYGPLLPLTFNKEYQ